MLRKLFRLYCVLVVRLKTRFLFVGCGDILFKEEYSKVSATMLVWDVNHSADRFLIFACLVIFFDQRGTSFCLEVSILL